MITRDEALERARAWMSEGRVVVPEIGLYEFDLGWVAWREVPAPTDPSCPPASTGGPQIVVDSERGEITTWQPLPAPLIAEQYAESRAAQDRFPPEVARVLLDAGWFPGRDIGAEIDAWAAARLGGPAIFPAARAVLAEFGGLTIGDRAGWGFTSYLYPARSGVVLGRSPGLTEEYGIAAFPLGVNEDDGEIAMDEQGRVYFLHWADWFHLGATIEEALVSLIRGGDWPTDGDEGWPLSSPGRA